MKKSIFLTIAVILSGCKPEPELHLFDGGEIDITLPVVKLELDAYWDYQTSYGDYDWRSEWYYGWDEADQQLFGNIGYTEPDIFLLRRYYTGSEPFAAHTSVLSNSIKGNTLKDNIIGAIGTSSCGTTWPPLTACRA